MGNVTFPNKTSYFAWKLKGIWKGLVAWLMCIFSGHWLLWLLIHLTNTLWKTHLWAAPAGDGLPVVMGKVTCGSLCHLTLHMCITGKTKHLLITHVNQTNLKWGKIKKDCVPFFLSTGYQDCLQNHLHGYFRPHHKPAHMLIPKIDKFVIFYKWLITSFASIAEKIIKIITFHLTVWEKKV